SSPPSDRRRQARAGPAHRRRRRRPGPCARPRRPRARRESESVRSQAAPETALFRGPGVAEATRPKYALPKSNAKRGAPGAPQERPFMLIHLSSWPEIEARLGRSKTVVVPIGSNEQHGPTGLLGTDWLCPEIIAHAAERQDGAITVAPTFNIGMAQHHLAFPGTISLRPSTFMAAIADWVSSLTRHGFD